MPLKAGEPITSVKVWLGDKPEVGACLKETLSICVPKKFQDSIKIETKMIEPIEAPIKAGTKVGTLQYSYGEFTSKPYDLFAISDVNKAQVMQRAKATIEYLIFGRSEGKAEESTVKNVSK